MSAQGHPDTSEGTRHRENFPGVELTMAQQEPPPETTERPSIATKTRLPEGQAFGKAVGKRLSTLAPRVARYDLRRGEPLMSRLDASPEEKYYQTMALAESATSLDERARIWSAYLNGNPKSKYRDEAIAQLATTLYERVKDNPQEENVTSTIQFFQENAKVLEKVLGKEGFAHRLAQLFVFKRQASPEQQ